VTVEECKGADNVTQDTRAQANLKPNKPLDEKCKARNCNIIISVGQPPPV